MKINHHSKGEVMIYQIVLTSLILCISSFMSYIFAIQIQESDGPTKITFAIGVSSFVVMIISFIVFIISCIVSIWI